MSNLKDYSKEFSEKDPPQDFAHLIIPTITPNEARYGRSICRKEGLREPLSVILKDVDSYNSRVDHSKICQTCHKSYQWMVNDPIIGQCGENPTTEDLEKIKKLYFGSD